MSTGYQCDNCRLFSGQSHGWLYVAQQPSEDDTSEAHSMLAALFGTPVKPLTFCTVKCLAEWAFVRVAAEEAATGTEPRP